MSVWIGSARSDERGRATGGRAGDQTGREVSTQKWYRHKKGWRVFRAKDPAKAAEIARAMEKACGCARIGYDQYQRNSLYNALKPLDFDFGRLDKKVETDCSALVRVCCACAGVALPDFNTASQPRALLESRAFVELKGALYTDSSARLGPGDILVTPVKGHTVVVLTAGAKYDGFAEKKEYAPGERLLKHGCEGRDVQILQQQLIELGYDLGSYGADGDFGDCTELAVTAFQRDHGLEPDGVAGPLTFAALEKEFEAEHDDLPEGKDSGAEHEGVAEEKEPEAEYDDLSEEKESGPECDDLPEEKDSGPVYGGEVLISGGQCWIREQPEPDARRLAVALRGSRWPWLGEISPGGWPAIQYENRRAWVSGRYGRVTENV